MAAMFIDLLLFHGTSLGRVHRVLQSTSIRHSATIYTIHNTQYTRSTLVPFYHVVLTTECLISRRPASAIAVR